MTRVRFFPVGTPMARRCGLLVLALLLLWLLLRAATLDGDAALGWLRRSRDARAYVRPGSPTALLDAAAPCDVGVRLLLLVASRPDGEDQRRAVRGTWGRALRDTRLVFMLGHHDSPYLQPALTREASEHGDIVVEDFVDNYHNLTLKTLFMLKWAAARCPSAPYVMKTDDDMLVNVRRVLREVEARGAQHAPPFVFGHVGVGEPQRSRRSKWYLPPWLYPADVLPEFLSGAGYVMSRPAVRQLLDRAMEVPLINLEDVYVTGLLAGRDPRIPLLTAAGARVERPLFMEHPCLLHHGFVVHGFGPAELAAAWRRLRALDAEDCRAAWVRCLAGLLRVADFSVVTDAGWGA